MSKVWLMPGTHMLCIHVDTGGKQCECPVSCDESGVGLIIAPNDYAIRKDILETPGLLQVVRSFNERITCLKLIKN